MKNTCLFIIILLGFSIATYSQTVSIDLPATVTDLEPAKGNDLIRRFKTKLAKRTNGYSFLAEVQMPYSYGFSPVVMNLDAQRNLVSSEALAPLRMVGKNDTWRFRSFLLFQNKCYVIYSINLEEDKRVQWVAYPYTIGEDMANLQRPILLKEYDQESNETLDFLELTSRGKYYLYNTRFVKGKVDISFFELTENLTGKITPFKISFSVSSEVTSLAFNSIEMDSKGNLLIIYQEKIKPDPDKDKAFYTNYYLAYNQSTKRSSITQLGEIKMKEKNCSKIGVDGLDNVYVLLTGIQTDDIFDNETFRIFKFDKDGKFVKKSLLELPFYERLMYLRGDQGAMYKQKGTEFLTTKKEYTDIEFACSKDGSVATFLIQEGTIYDVQRYEMFYIYPGFHFLGINTSTLEMKAKSFGRRLATVRVNAGDEFIFTGNKSLTLLFYSYNKNFKQDLTLVEPKKLADKWFHKEYKDYGMYTWTVDNKLNFKTEKVVNPEPQTILLLPPVKVSDNEYFFIASETFKYKSFKIGLMKYKE